jgi:16S rRNA (adenine1518-N6/adenine1519-N6)-dimethyltransferase
MVDAAGIVPGEHILEIGPGEGVLTKELLAAGAKVVAVETDERCVEILNDRFGVEISEKRLMLIEGDIRNDETVVRLFSRAALGNLEYKLVANIPYYITGMLFRLFLEKLRQPECIVFLVQKEVAEEIVTRDNKEGILSLSVKAYGNPRYISKVRRESFSPPPKVDSAILAITDINRKRVSRALEQRYFAVIKAGLGSRRKMLLGNLMRIFPDHRGDLEAAFTKLDIDRGIRGEDLPFEKWLMLVKELPNLES